MSAISECAVIDSESEPDQQNLDFSRVNTTTDKNTKSLIAVILANQSSVEGVRELSFGYSPRNNRELAEPLRRHLIQEKAKGTTPGRSARHLHKLYDAASLGRDTKEAYIRESRDCSFLWIYWDDYHSRGW